MFEGWASEFLAASLGRFVDVQKDKLRISLWSGSGVLENVRLRAEAFDYLKLPVAIHEGVVGRLRIKIPWGNWLTGSLVVELSDVVLCATERDDSEWEEAAALRREQAAKQADLAAAELAKLSQRMVVQQQQPQLQALQQQQQQQHPHGHLSQARAAGPAGQRGSHGGAGRGIAAAADAGGSQVADGGSAGAPPAAAGGGPTAAVASPIAAASHAASLSADAHAGTAGAAAAAAPVGVSGASGASAVAPAAAAGTGGGGFGGGLWGAALQYLSQFLLNRLQFSVRNVHIAFRGRQDGVPFAVGVALDSLSTVPEPKAPKSVLARLYGAALGRHAHAKLARHIGIRGLGVYWRAPRPDAACQPAHGTAGSAPLPLPPPHPDDYIISPVDSVLRITVVGSSTGQSSSSAHLHLHPLHHPHPYATHGGTAAAPAAATAGLGAGDGAAGASAAAAGLRHSSAGSGVRHHHHHHHHPLQQQQQAHAAGTTGAAASAPPPPGTHVEAAAGVDSVQIRIRPEQLQSMAQLADDLAVWARRNRYGRFRPPGWCTAAQIRRVHADAGAMVAAEAAAVSIASAASAVGTGSSAGPTPGSQAQLQRSSSDPGRIQAMSRSVLQSVQEEDEGQAGGGGAAGRRCAQNAQIALPDGPTDRGGGAGDDSREEDSPLPSPSPSALSLWSRRAYASSAALFGADGGASTSVEEEPAASAVLSAEGRHRSASAGSNSGGGAIGGGGFVEPSSAGVSRAPGTGHQALAPSSSAAAAGAGAAAPKQASPSLLTQATRTPRPADAPFPATGPAGAVTAAAVPVPASPPPVGCTGALRWCHVWQYAVRAVLHDVRERRGTRSLRDYLQYKRQYTRLYRRKLEHLRQAGVSGGGGAGGTGSGSSGGASAAGGQSLSPAEEWVELQRLEAYLPVADILTFRQLTERALEDEQERERAAAADAGGGSGVSSGGGGQQADAGSPQHRSWLAWGLSGVSGFFMYGSGGGGSGSGGAKAAVASQVPQAPLTDAELAELYRLLQGTSLQAAVAPASEAALGRQHPHQPLHAHHGAAAPAGVPFTLQVRVLQLAIDIKGPSGGEPRQKDRDVIRGPAGERDCSGAGSPAASPAASAACSSPASAVASPTRTSAGGAACAASAPFLLSLVLGSAAAALESDGFGTALQASIGTLHAYDMCSDPGVMECILAQADDMEPGASAATAAVGAGTAAASGGGGRSPAGEAAAQRRRRGATHGSWASLGQLLSGAGGRSPGMPSSISTDSLDSDVGHWSMGYQSQSHTAAAPPPADAWFTGPPVVSLWQAGADGGGGGGPLELHVRPLRLLYRAACLAAVGSALAVDSTASLEHHTMHAIAGFGDRDARVLAMLQHLGCTAPSQKLKLQVEGLEIVMPLESPPFGDGAGVGEPAGACYTSADGTTAGGTGLLTIGLYDVELASVRGLPPAPATPPQAKGAAAAAERDEASDGCTQGAGGSGGAPRGAYEEADEAAADRRFGTEAVSLLQQMMQRRLSPSSTTVDLAALAEAAAELSIGSRARSPHGSAAGIGAHEGVPEKEATEPLPGGGGSPGGCGTPNSSPDPRFAASRVDPRGVAASQQPCLVEDLARLFLYEHLCFAVHAVRLSYQLPPVRVSPLAAACQRTDGRRGSQSQLLRQSFMSTSAAQPRQRGSSGDGARSLALLPPGLQLRGYLSRSRLEQGAGAPASLLRLSLSGLSTMLHASQVEDLQRLARSLPSARSTAASAGPAPAPAAPHTPAHAGSPAANAPPSPQARGLGRAPDQGTRPEATQGGPAAASAAPATALDVTPTEVKAAGDTAQEAAARNGELSAAISVQLTSGSLPGGAETLSGTDTRVSADGGVRPPDLTVVDGPRRWAGFSCGGSAPRAASCTRSAPPSPLPSAFVPNRLFGRGTAAATAASRGRDGVDPGGRFGRRASLGSGPAGPEGATAPSMATGWGGPGGRASAGSGDAWQGVGVAESGAAAAAPAAPPPGRDMSLHDVMEPHTLLDGGCNRLRLPPLPRTTCLFLSIEPFEVTYVLDGDAMSGAPAAAESVAPSPGPALMVRASGRTQLCASYCSGLGGCGKPAAAAATSMSLALHGLELQVVPPTPSAGTGNASAEAGFSNVRVRCALWSLAHTVWVASLTATTSTAPGGALSACAALRGLRLLGPTDRPGNFILSNGPGPDDAAAALRYWSAGAQPPPDPAVAAAAAAALAATGWWQPSQPDVAVSVSSRSERSCNSLGPRSSVDGGTCHDPFRDAGGAPEMADIARSCRSAAGGGADGEGEGGWGWGGNRGAEEGVRPDAGGGGSGSEGGMELVVSDVAVGMGLLLSLSSAFGGGSSSPSAELPLGTTDGVSQDRSGAEAGDGCFPGDPSGGEAASGRNADRGATPGTVAAAADHAASWPLPSPAAPHAPPTATPASPADASASSQPTPQTSVTVQLRSCAILAVSPSRTPFAAASGGAGHLACNALLSVDELSYNLQPPPPAAPASCVTASPLGPHNHLKCHEHASAAPAAAGSEPHGPVGHTMARTDDVGEPAGRSVGCNAARRGRGGGGGAGSCSSEAAQHRVIVRGLLLYLADNPDSAYLSPVLLLPELASCYCAAAAGPPCQQQQRQPVAGALVACAGPGTSLEPAASAASLSLDLGRVEASLQPQQAGVLCALLADLSPPAGDGQEEEGDQRQEAEVELQQRQQRQGKRPIMSAQELGPVCLAVDVAAAAASADAEPSRRLSGSAAAAVSAGGAQPWDPASSLPSVTLSVQLASLTALLGSDTLSEEATVLYWRDVCLSYGRTDVDVESSLAWRDLTLSGVGLRLHRHHIPAHDGWAATAAAAAEAGGGGGGDGGGDGEDGDGRDAAAAAELKIHAGSLAIMCELSSYTKATQPRVETPATSRPAPAALPAGGPVSPLAWPAPPRPQQPQQLSITAAAARAAGAAAGSGRAEGGGVVLGSSPASRLFQPQRSSGLGPGLGLLPRAGSQQQLTDGGGGGEADAEFYSVEGGSSALDLEADPVDARELDDLGGHLPETGAETEVERPGSVGALERSASAASGGGRRGAALRAHLLSSGRSIAQLATLPPVHLPLAAAAWEDPSPSEEGVDVGAGAGSSGGHPAPAAVVLVSAGAPCRPLELTALAGAGSGTHSAVLATLLIRVRLAGGPCHRTALCSPSPSSPRAAGIATADLGAGLQTGTASSGPSSHRSRSSSSGCGSEAAMPPPRADQRRNSHERSPASGGSPRAPSELCSSPPHVARQGAAAAAAAQPCRPHFDIDLSGLHVLVSSTQWYRLQDSLAASERHWRTAAAGQLRARLQQQQQWQPRALPDRRPAQQAHQRQSAASQLEVHMDTTRVVRDAGGIAADVAHARVSAALAAAAAARNAVPDADSSGAPQAGIAASAAATAADDPDQLLQLLLDLPATASLSVQDASIVVYAAREPASAAGRGRAAAHQAPPSGFAGSRPHSHPGLHSAASAASTTAAAAAAEQRCVRLDVILGASVESDAGGCLDRLTLVLPEVCMSTGLLRLAHDPRVGTWHGISDAWRLALLEGLSCAAVPHLRRGAAAREEGGRRGEGQSHDAGQGPTMAGSKLRVTPTVPQMAATSAVAATAAAEVVPVAGRVDLAAWGGGAVSMGAGGASRAPQDDADTATVAPMGLEPSSGARQDSGSERDSGSQRSPGAGPTSPRPRLAQFGAPGGDSSDPGGGETGDGNDLLAVHALLEASLRQASLYASRRALLGALAFAHDTQNCWERGAAAATHRRRAFEGSDSEGEGDGNDGDGGGGGGGSGGADFSAVGLLDERTLRLVRSPGIAAIAAAAVAGPRGGEWEPPGFCGGGSAAAAAGAAMAAAAAAAVAVPRGQQHHDMWPHDADDEHDGAARGGGGGEGRFPGPEVLYQYQYHNAPHRHANAHEHQQARHPFGRRRPSKAPAAAGAALAGRSLSKGSDVGAAAGARAGANAGHGDWLGMPLPAWLPLCCLTLRVGKAAAVLYTDVQGYDVPLLEAAISPLELQVKLNALGDATDSAVSFTTAAGMDATGDAAPPTGAGDAAAGSFPASQSRDRSLASLSAAADERSGGAGRAAAAPAYARYKPAYTANAAAAALSGGPLPSADGAAMGKGGTTQLRAARLAAVSSHRAGGGAAATAIAAAEAVVAVPAAAMRGAAGAGSARPAGPVSVSCVHVVLDASLLLDVYNLDKLGWEPVLEPWAVQVLYEGRQPSRAAPLRRPSSLGSASPASAAKAASGPTPSLPRHSVSLTTNTLLEATLSPGLIPAARAAAQLAEELQGALSSLDGVHAAAAAAACTSWALLNPAAAAVAPFPDAGQDGGAARTGKHNPVAASAFGGRGGGLATDPWVASRPDALPRLWLQNYLGQPVSFVTLEQRPNASYLAAVGAVGAVDGVVTHGSVVVVDSVPQAGRRLAGRHVAPLPQPWHLDLQSAQHTYHHNNNEQRLADVAAAAAASQCSDGGGGGGASRPLHRRSRSEGHPASRSAAASVGSDGATPAGSKVLYCRLYGTSTWLGPIPCSAAPTSRFYFSLPPAGVGAAPRHAIAALAASAPPPPGLRLVCDVRPHRLCSRRLEMRSNIRLRNASGLWLSLGDWALLERALLGPDGGGGGSGGAGDESQVFMHTLPPGGGTWLTTAVLQQSPVVLAMRAAGPSAFADGGAPAVDGYAAGVAALVAKTAAGPAAAGGRSVVRFRSLGGGGYREPPPGVAKALSSAPWSDWSTPVDLTSMLFDAVSQGLGGADAATASSRLGVARRVYCTMPMQAGDVAASAGATTAAYHLIVHLAPVTARRGSGAAGGASSSSQRPEWELVVMAPVVLRNDLPVPARFALQAYSGVGGGAVAAAAPTATALPAPELRESLHALTSLHLHAFPAHRLVSVACRPAGYAWSGGQLVYGRSCGGGAAATGDGEDGEDFEPLHPGLELPSASSGGGGAVLPYCEAVVQVRPTQAGLQDLLLMLRTWRHRPTGQVRLELSCPVWIYNCTGLPVHLRPTARLVLGLPGQPASIVGGGAPGSTSAATGGSDRPSPGGGDDTAWVPPCLSLGGKPTAAAAAGPCTSQLAALQAAAGLFAAAAAAGRGGRSHGVHADLAAVARDAMSSCGGCAGGISATARSSSSVRSQRSIGGQTAASSARSGGFAAGAAGTAGGFGSTGLLAALAAGGGSIGGDGASLDSLGAHLHGGPAAALAQLSPRHDGNRGHDGDDGEDSEDSAAAAAEPPPPPPDQLLLRHQQSSPLALPHQLLQQPLHQIARHPSLDQLILTRPPRPNQGRPPDRLAPLASGLSGAAAEQPGASLRIGANPRPHHYAFSPLGGGGSAPPVHPLPQLAAAAATPSSLASAFGAAYSRVDSPFGSGGGAADGRPTAPLQPCMYGGMPVGVGQVELCVWHGGSGGWSPPVWPDVDGSPLHVTLPCPLPDSDGGISAAVAAGSSAAGSSGGSGGGGGGGRPAFEVVARLANVGTPGGGGTGNGDSGGRSSGGGGGGGWGVRSVALHLLPRYVVHNGLSAAVQVRQQGTSHASSLGPSERRPVQWADIGLPRKLQIRIQDPGWSWSGGVALDSVGPGDLFVKIRHRNRAETQLVRVDVSVSAAGTMLLSLSHHHTDFAPYRIDNCSGEVLHVQQVGCLDQEDVIRPYACLPYTWDEHTAKQRVLVSLPGRRRLGEYELEKVGFSKLVPVVASQTGGHGRKNLLVTITADGPTRVLKVVDTAVHPTAATHGSAATTTSPPRRRPARRGGAAGAASATAANDTAAAGGAGEEWQLEVTAAVAGVAVSVVSERAEVLYALLQGLHATVLVGPAKVSVSAALAHMRVDNCLRGAAFPIVLYSPVGRSMFNTAILLPVPAPPSTSAAPPAAAATAAGAGQAPRPGPQTQERSGSSSALALFGARPPSRRPSAATLPAGPQPAAPDGAAAHGVSSGGAGAGRATTPPPVALAGRLVVWRNRPGGVTCVQYASLTAAPLALSVEETHLREVIRLASQFAAAAAAADMAAAAPPRPTSGGVSGVRSPSKAGAPPPPSGDMPLSYVPDLSLLRPASPPLTEDSYRGFSGLGGGGRSGSASQTESTFPLSSGLAGRRPSVVAASSHHSAAAVGAGGPSGELEFPRHGATAGGLHESGPSRMAAGAGGARMRSPPLSSRYRDDRAGAGGGGAGGSANSAAGPGGPDAAGPALVIAARSHRIYIEELHIGDIRISTSFAPRPYGGGGAAAAAAAPDDGGFTAPDDDGDAAAGAGAAGDGADGSGGGGGLVDSAVRLAVSLAHLEGAWVLLRPLEMRYALMRKEALGQNLLSHYTNCALLELIKLVGSLDIFGDVVRLLQGLGGGVWHLISRPVEGAMRGDMRKFMAGVASGVGGMVCSFTYAATNSVVKASRRARSTLAHLAPEPLNHSAPAVAATAGGGSLSGGASGAAAAQIADGGGGGDGSGQLVPYSGHAVARGARGQSASGQRDILPSIWEGYAAILQRVATQASRLSPTGTARELILGGLGAVALPSMAVLQLMEVAATSLRASVAPHHHPHPHGPSLSRGGGVRPRIPRHVDPGAPLQRYCWLESMCRLLQREVRGGAYAEEGYVGGVQMSDCTFAVVTRRHLLLVSPTPRQSAPPPEWRAAHPSDLALSLVVPLEGLVMASVGQHQHHQQADGAAAAAAGQQGFMPSVCGDEGDGGGGGRLVCIAHMQVGDAPLRLHHHHHHHRHGASHRAHTQARAPRGVLRLQPPPQPPPQSPDAGPGTVARAATSRSHSLSLSLPQPGGAWGGAIGGGSGSQPAGGVPARSGSGSGGGGGGSNGGTGWSGAPLRNPADSSAAPSLLSLRYRQASPPPQQQQPAAQRGAHDGSSGGTGAWAGSSTPSSSTSSSAGPSVASSPPSSSGGATAGQRQQQAWSQAPATGTLRGSQVRGHGAIGASASVVGFGAEEEAVEEEEARLLPPPSPWLCVTTLELSSEADAARLVSLLEQVRRWYDGQRDTSGCRMIGF